MKKGFKNSSKDFNLHWKKNSQDLKSTIKCLNCRTLKIYMQTWLINQEKN